MIISIAELREFINTSKSDSALGTMISSAESFVLSFTHNNFINRITGLVEYPPDVKMGVINLISYDIHNRDKIGIASETISRHSISYSQATGNDSQGGYPASLTTFLHPYMKARF